MQLSGRKEGPSSWWIYVDTQPVVIYQRFATKSRFELGSLGQAVELTRISCIT